jgi:hypothetical protein
VGTVTTVRKLHHPIAMFIVAVLAVICIGVGVVAVTQTSKVYGPSWGRFSVAFRGRVYMFPGHTSVTVSGSNASSPVWSTVTLEFPFEYSIASTPTTFCAVGVACDPNELDASVLRVTSGQPGVVAVHQMGSALAKVDFAARVAEVEQNANSLSVIMIGPQCRDDQCRDAEVVSNGRVLWCLLAFSKGSVSTVEGFLASFQPIG